jgi:hypothetical protein
VFKPSRRAAVIAASFALGLSAVGPAASAGLLGGSDSDSMAVEGVALPVGGDLLGGDLLGGLLGGDLLGGVLGGDLLGGVLGGDLLGGGLPLVGGVLGEDGVLGGELLNVATDTTLHCDAAIPQVLRTFLGEATDAVCEPFSNGLLGLLGSL